MMSIINNLFMIGDYSVSQVIRNGPYCVWCVDSYNSEWPTLEKAIEVARDLYELATADKNLND